MVAPQLHAELAQYAVNADLRHRAAAFAPEVLEGAVAVIAATDERAVNAAVSAAARARGIPVNVVDDAELSTFIFPAIIDRSPLIVAVSSAGAAPVLARGVRAQIEALLPARLGALARFMGRHRKTVQRALAEARPPRLLGAHRARPGRERRAARPGGRRRRRHCSASCAPRSSPLRTRAGGGAR